MHVPLPRGADPLPLIMDRFDMRYGYENLQPGVLVLAMRTGLPLTAYPESRWAWRSLR